MMMTINEFTVSVLNYSPSVILACTPTVVIYATVRSHLREYYHVMVFKFLVGCFVYLVISCFHGPLGTSNGHLLTIEHFVSCPFA